MKVKSTPSFTGKLAEGGFAWWKLLLGLTLAASCFG
jgi:hypothetical protein